MGGVAGHMAHLSEDLDLTFNEIVDILGKVANAEIENVTEKVDGQNLFLTVDNTGNVRTARNNTDIKKGGMSTEEYISKWRGHPAESAFTNGFKAITAALKTLTPDALQDLFGGGERYVNMEIMYPKNPNIIHYSAPHVVLHGLKYFGSHEGEEQQQLANEAFIALAQAVDGAEQEIGEELWTTHGPKIVELQALADGTALAEVTQKIEEFASPVGMDAKLEDIVSLYLRQFAENEGLPDDVIDDLILLSIHPDEAKDKGITVGSIKKDVPKELRHVVSTVGTKTNSRKIHTSILQPIEKAISDFAIEVLRGVKSYFVDSNEKEVRRMRNELETSIQYLKGLQATGDEKMGELVDKQLSKLGNVENVASSMEGIVFEYPPGSGKIYKLTGAFAMANQIIGRARRSGMNEGLSQLFTIVISKDREITKTLKEWLTEASESGHKFQRLPKMVYKDVLAGTPIVDIVVQENAERTIYNAVMGYVNGLQEEDEFEIDIVDDEQDDPVVDADFPKTVAIVPGAFKPPHRGHADMVRRYATGDGVRKADKVYVVISAPMNAQRTFRTRVDGKLVEIPIDANNAIALWKKLFPEVANLPEVEFEIAPSDMRSPITVAFKYISSESPLPLNDGDSVILGASDKLDTKEEPDWRRWDNINKEKHVKPGIELLSGEEYAVPALERSDSEGFSASTMRDLISDLIENPSNREAYAELAEFVPVDKFPALFDELGVPAPASLDETSGAGAVAGPAAPLGSTSVSRGPLTPTPKKKKKKSKQKEYIDLSLIDEVMKLIIERGIAQ